MQFVFNIPLIGEAMYKIEAESLEEATRMLIDERDDVGEGIDNKYLQEYDYGWDETNILGLSEIEKVATYGEEI